MCPSVCVCVCFRFPETELISAFGVLSMRPITFLSEDQLNTWGCDQLDQLLDHFGKEVEVTWKEEDGSEKSNISTPLCDPEATREEWKEAKSTVKAQLYPRDSTDSLWKLISQFHKADFPNLMKLAQIRLVLPVHTADVERGFSSQNLVCTARRNRLTVEMQDMILKTKLEGQKEREESYLHTIVSKWASKKKRQLFRNNDAE